MQNNRNEIPLHFSQGRTCNTLGKFSLCASWVAIVDFPTQAVPQTRITSGTLWWWNLTWVDHKRALQQNQLAITSQNIQCFIQNIQFWSAGTLQMCANDI